MTQKLLFAALAAVFAGAAHAADTGFYVGGGVGQSDFADDLNDQVRRAYTGNVDYAVTSVEMTDDSDTAYKIFGGYRFLPWLGVELAWNDLGEARSHYVLHSLVPLTNADAILDGRYQVKGASLSVFGELAFTETFSGIARVGVFDAKIDYEETGVQANGDPWYFKAPDDNSTKTTIGLGVNWRITPNVDLRLDYDRYHDIGRRFALDEKGNGRFDYIDVASLNLAYRFGQ
ncbi:MAG TPA: outer membrane beta-barrel protein [Tahibacter sp.]|nr:outer membrane beta-barrel protein [Tahibacter sp.]